MRINCGGEEFQGADGRTWGGDRFFHNGSSVERLQIIEDTGGDDALFETERFWRSKRRKGYSIPLPRGRYRITLSFAEVWFRKAGKRQFDVLLEGEPVPGLENYEPKIDRAESFTHEVKVEDGHLDLQFIRKRDNPKISAIAIVPVKF